MHPVIDHYEILGVPHEATPDEIKRAYRRLALRLHPDINPDPKDTARFKQITHAFDVLSDPRSRDVLDRDLRYGTQASAGDFTIFVFYPPEQPSGRPRPDRSAGATYTATPPGFGPRPSYAPGGTAGYTSRQSRRQQAGGWKSIVLGALGSLAYGFMSDMFPDGIPGEFMNTSRTSGVQDSWAPVGGAMAGFVVVLLLAVAWYKQEMRRLQQWQDEMTALFSEEVADPKANEPALRRTRLEAILDWSRANVAVVIISCSPIGACLGHFLF